MLPDLQFLVLHELSWSDLLDYALISKAHLRLVQSYLKCYPKRINRSSVFLRLLGCGPKDPRWDYSLLNSNYSATEEIKETEPRVPWSYDLLSKESLEDFWNCPVMAIYRRALGTQGLW